MTSLGLDDDSLKSDFMVRDWLCNHYSN